MLKNYSDVPSNTVSRGSSESQIDVPKVQSVNVVSQPETTQNKVDASQKSTNDISGTVLGYDNLFLFNKL